MIIIGVDFHPGSQQIASVDTDTGVFEEKRLAHREEAEKFYRDLASRGAQIRVGMEASGYARWFEGLLAELQIELWIGDASEIERKRARKQKTDREDAQHILQLMLKDDFPKIWVASWENRDLRQLRWRCHSSCRRSRFSQLATQILGKSSFSMSCRICCASSRSVFCFRARLRSISDASPIHNSICNSASRPSNQRAYPLASIPTRI